MKTADEINIPDNWCAQLDKIKLLDPNAVIAGGAVRDLFCGREVKDIDIFTNTMPDIPLNEAGMDYEGMKYVQAVASIADAPEFNLIQIEHNVSNAALISSFDFGLCQIGFDGTKVFKTPAFDWDFKYNLFTMRHIDRYPRSILRYARINQRYNMEIAIPELDERNKKCPA